MLPFPILEGGGQQIEERDDAKVISTTMDEEMKTLERLGSMVDDETKFIGSTNHDGVKAIANCGSKGRPTAQGSSYLKPEALVKLRELGHIRDQKFMSSNLASMTSSRQGSGKGPLEQGLA